MLENISHVRVHAVWGRAAENSAHKSKKSVSAEKSASPAEVSHNRTLVEFCCGPNSVLGTPSKASTGCSVIRLTEDDDVTTKSGLDKAKKAVKQKPVLLWASMPCTGGCP